MNEKTKVKPMLNETYLAAVKNSVGSNMFRNLYAKVDGEEKDITENGNLSCAFFVSAILVIFKLISEVHATVNGTLRDLKILGWTEINEPRVGAILVWAQKDFGIGGKHRHIGFYIGDGKAVSNNSEKGCPVEHDWSEYDNRKIETILWHPILEK